MAQGGPAARPFIILPGPPAIAAGGGLARPAGSPPAGPGYYACRKARASAAKSGVPRPVAGFHGRPGEPV